MIFFNYYRAMALRLILLLPCIIYGQTTGKTQKKAPAAAQTKTPKPDTTYKTVAIPAEYEVEITRVTDKITGQCLAVDKQNRVYVAKRTVLDNMTLHGSGRYNGTSWEWFKGMGNEYILKIEIDEADNVYAITELLSERGSSNIYKLNADTWELISPSEKGQNTYLNRYAFLGNDGVIYSGYESSTSLSFFKLVNRQWKTVTSALPMKDIFKKFIVGKNGKIYALTNNCYDCAYAFSIWDGNAWKTLGEKIAKPEFLAADKDDQIYLGQMVSGRTYYEKVGVLKKLKDTTWVDLETPIANLSAYDLQSNLFLDRGTLFCRTSKNYITAKHTDGLTEHELFRYSDGLWQKTGGYNNYNKQAYRYDYLYTSDETVYLARYDGNDGYFIFKAEKKKISDERFVIQKMYAIPINKTDSFSTANRASLAKMKILNQEGKLGICNEKGEELIYPVFDQITAEPNKEISGEGNLSDILFNCTSWKTTIKVIAREKSPISLKAPADKEITCEKCDANGNMPDHLEKVEIEGEWVAGKQTQSTAPTYENVWDPIGKRYVTKTTYVTTTYTRDRYQKPSTYKYVTVKGGICPTCKGKKKMKSSTYYRYNFQKKIYEQDVMTK